ncbi:hypothetical protein H5410_060730, partial [Solanum commersonii]
TLCSYCPNSLFIVHNKHVSEHLLSLKIDSTSALLSTTLFMTPRSMIMYYLSLAIKMSNLKFVVRYNGGLSYFPVIDKWLEFAVNKEVEDLRPNMSYRISLTLKNLFIRDEHIKQIMSNCPQLESLNLYGFCGFNHLHKIHRLTPQNPYRFKYSN